MNNWLPSLKQSFPYLCDSPSQTLQQVTKDLAGAYKNFFEKRADRIVEKAERDAKRGGCFGSLTGAFQLALLNLGVTPAHRRSFKPVHKMLYQDKSVTP